MAPKTVFLASAEEDGLSRDLFITQWSRAGARVRFLDPPGGEACSQQWQQEVRKRIRLSDGVIALIGGYTCNSADELWQIRCAVAEGKPLLGLWVEFDYRVKPVEMGSALCEAWTWENIGDFIDALPPEGSRTGRDHRTAAVAPRASTVSSSSDALNPFTP